MSTHSVEGSGKGRRNVHCGGKQRIMRDTILYLQSEISHPAEGSSRRVFAKRDGMEGQRFPTEAVRHGWYK